ncbi:Na/Pi cotransporter family protein [Pseudomonas aeruginosa]|uniref:Na/Pi cotransporter family protein n=1 Tax=Pseudomonas aeruginosa TaxID=287 RepID=UPI00071B29BA|nr:Na/Pi cotransporter family protein [Pseudomonas aeruginosa]KSC40191.1 Na/Pi cotransporter [Pseudomonas aeruginosa]MDP5468821.1 Na/Pi cotransporter family protein [Pseudomonas aeruginosa]HCF7065324.1 Na/Pi cotransporter family protein [Pseudomonas aeruginosa]
MLGTILLINLAGAVALLLWGTHMVSSGVLRGFGTVLRNWLGRHLGNRWLALLAGLGITGLLQSSTATSLMAASFTASGTLGLAPALAVMLGANVGTTLVVQLLSFDTSLLAPLALLSGLLLFRLGDGPRLESLGQCLIGLGLMLLALALLGHSLQQIEASPAFVAVVLLVASLAQAGLVSLPIALALVLGANLGGALPALGVAGSRVARRLPLGNLLVRLLGCLLVLPWLTALAQPANALGGAAAVWFHSAFNLALALLAIGFTGPLAALLARLLPEEAQSDEPGMPRYLDEAGLEVANIGLANATREVLRLADMASLMLRATSGLLQRPEAKVAAEIRRQDQALDQLSAAIRAYLADLGQDGLGDSDADRAQEILLFAINIEHIGDLVANSLLPLAMRWAGRSRAGSEFELGRMLPLQAAIEESLHLAISAFLREDLDAALRLVARKKLLQRLEADASRERFRRLRDDRGAWVESGDVFQRILRDYRRIHHHVTALAYPLLERSGIDPMAKRPDEPGQGEGSACAS